MSRYVCLVCGYVYDQKDGDPDSGTPPGTDFNALPEDWRCPECGADRGNFGQDGVPWSGGPEVATAWRAEDSPVEDRGQSKRTYGFEDHNYECACGYLYLPVEGEPRSGIPPETRFSDLPEDWVCPECGSPQEDFRVI
ncbi:rubredoxin [Pseudodesulfovibrio karagichevae]|uniref:Rubredoxin n=1 Tax=Pseudodesulfovibrio karagichevae TaxID=3239305 RepID=A0ABV4K3V2_9BACT